MSELNNDPNNNLSDDYSGSYSYVSENSSVSHKKNKKHSGLKITAFILSLAIVGAGSIQVYKYVEANSPEISDFDESSDNSENDNSKSQNSESDSSEDEVQKVQSVIDISPKTDAMAIPDIVENVMPSVVGVSATFAYSQPNYGYGWGWGYDSGVEGSSRNMIGTGTGIIMSKDGYIVTNAHCIYDESEYKCGLAVDVSVLFMDETEAEAKIIGYDTETDLAVLKVDKKNLTPAPFGESSELRVGETVIAIGNPLGFELFGSVTSGIVSALDRQISINEKNMTLIQTDAAINSGNSGGPLLNGCGQVVGINSAKMSSSYGSASIEGLGFAIPIDSAKVIIDDLINYRYVKGRPQIGISTKDVTETISNYYNIPMGVYVVSVQEDSTAEFAGIKVGDVIIAVDGESITTGEELNEKKSLHKAGDEITLTVSRGGEDIDITLVLQEANNSQLTESED
ncbi:MAG: S1C family serine protease [Ruminococcus sp.]|nr:trypsin-like peptidase domain-containing protein [Oscillospiraceae bacterium]